MVSPMIAQRGDGCARRLRNDDTHIGLRSSHAQCLGCLPLSAGDRKDRGADDLRVIGALTQGQAQYAGNKGTEHDSQTGQAVEDHEQLHQKGRAADDPDIKLCNALQNANARQAEDRGDKSQYCAAAERNNGQGYRIFQCCLAQRPERVEENLHDPHKLIAHTHTRFLKGNSRWDARWKRASPPARCLFI